MDAKLRHKQLFTPLKDFQIFDFFSTDKLFTKSGDNIPFISWPDGSPCFIANLYILELLKRRGRGGQGLSRKGNKCGTLGEYALQFGQLLNYCFYQGISLTDLTDSTFSEFIYKLRTQKSTRFPERDQSTTNRVISVGKTCLGFLEFVGRFHGDDNFVAENGTINITKRRVTARNKHQNHGGYSLDHHSFGPNARTRTRNPITPERTNMLRVAAADLTNSSHIKYRRSLSISLLEHTGCRIGELTETTTADIYNAIRMKHPKLRMVTFKQGGIVERLVPVTKMLLSEAIKYIELYRSATIRRFLKSDHGLLFVSDTTGKPLSSRYLSNEFGTLRHHAKIEEQACAHMFRHAFITNLFIELITRYEIENTSTFKHKLFLNAIFFAEIRELTGHKDPWSLVPYIHLAFKQISGFSKVMASINRSKVIDTFDQKHDELLQQLKHGMPVAEYIRQYAELVRLRDEDLLIADERNT
ncbi:site-specific integrase [Pseudomonas sp. PDM17]|uniref:tyrosine-type recombinase/integrase n=1 Tax=Pseudomonas sp. PDM17 TaxID=2769285 RepID=UPI0017868EA4|nr:site-specific integrase [Pseudomonas sp. PDM17]MBD9504602.1 site-specific integrase [Pseudomonas sp. PDM17]